MTAFSRPAPSRIPAGVALLAALALGGCVSNAPFDELGQVQPTGSAFSQALFKNYAYLARSYGLQNAPSGTAFDAEDSMSISAVNSDVATVANAFAAKAISAAKGEEPLPEPAPPGDDKIEALRLELLRALNKGRTKAPVEAARVQSDYDCWLMNAAVDELAASAAQCRRAFDASLAKLERSQGLSAPPSPSSELTPGPASAAAAPADFTVYFAFGSAVLTDRGQAVVRQAVEAARSGRQSRIAVVGHTDTAGTEEFNLALSKERAEAVKAAMVGMGARAEAVEISGVGESDLAVQTADNVPEAQNRRALVNLVP